MKLQATIIFMLSVMSMLHIPNLDAHGGGGGHHSGGGGHHGGGHGGRGYGRGGYGYGRGGYGYGGWGYDPYYDAALGATAIGLTAAAAAAASDDGDTETAYEAGYQKSKAESAREERDRLARENRRLRAQQQQAEE